MMFSSKNLIRKANQLRKQNWSAPTIMTVFIMFCMFIVFSFESIGILNKERNIEFRTTSPEKRNNKPLSSFLIVLNISFSNQDFGFESQQNAS